MTTLDAPAGPTIDCARLPAFDESSLDAVRRAFGSATAVSMRQAWRDRPEPAFAPSAVRTGWRDRSVFVFAELADADIFTDATDHNQRLCEIGDAFEMFFCPDGQEAYAEFHVAPNNLQLQLHFPDWGWRGRVSKDDAVLKALMPRHSFQSRTWIDAGAHLWSVVAEIPVAAVCGHARPLAGDAWRFSFCRYDHTRGGASPVISSTSPHPVPAFHRPQEWGLIRFRG